MQALSHIRAPRFNLDERDPAQLAWLAIEPIWDQVDHSGTPDAVDAQLAQLSASQRALLAIHVCVGEVTNGGFEQFFSDPSGVLTREAREGFVLVGEQGMASIIDQIVVLFPEEWPARERRIRNFQLRRLRGADAERIGAFEPYDNAFYGCLGLEELPGSCAAYVLEHPEEFVSG